MPFMEDVKDPLHSETNFVLFLKQFELWNKGAQGLPAWWQVWKIVDAIIYEAHLFFLLPKNGKFGFTYVDAP